MKVIPKSEVRDRLIANTRSLCPTCGATIDARLDAEDGQVVMSKTCAEHGDFRSLISSDAAHYLASLPFNKPGTSPLGYSTEVIDGCPRDCGLCPDHQQHTCLALIEVNSNCNLDCPLCFSDAKKGFELSLEQVDRMLDRFVELEAEPEVVQFSGGEPTLHPEIIPMMKLAQAKGIKLTMLNTNGIRISKDDRFLAQLADVRPTIYLQFDGLSDETYLKLRGVPLAETKFRALDRMAEAGLDVVLVPAIDRHVNHDEIGKIVEFGLKHPAVHGIAFQTAFYAGRHGEFDPMDRETIPDIIRGISEQTSGTFLPDDFVPVPCCHPTCRTATFAFIEGDTVTPLPRVIPVDQYLNYLTNRTLPDLDSGVLTALEGLWSASAVPGSAQVKELLSCSACQGVFPSRTAYVKSHVFSIVIQQFSDPWNVDIRTISKCCIGNLIPDGRIIPFCAFNTAGYREQVFEQLSNGHMRGV